MAQSGQELGRRLDAIKRALELSTDPQLRERIAPAAAARVRNGGRLEGQSRTIMRLATQRFGPETARRLARLLAGVTDQDRVDCVAEAVVDRSTGGEFLARVGRKLLQADQF